MFKGTVRLDAVYDVHMVRQFFKLDFEPSDLLKSVTLKSVPLKKSITTIKNINNSLISTNTRNTENSKIEFWSKCKIKKSELNRVKRDYQTFPNLLKFQIMLPIKKITS